MNKDKILISLIEDSEMHIEWLKSQLNNHERFNLVSVDSLGRKGIESIKKYTPDIVLLDFQLIDITGIEVAKRIKHSFSKIKIFAFTAHSDLAIVERMIIDKNIDAIAIKGSQYFENNLLSSIEHVANGDSYLDPSVLKMLRNRKDFDVLNKLTGKEFEVFIHTSSGKNDTKIAEDLCVELSYVRNLKTKISKKINHTDIKNLIKKLIENSKGTILNVK